MKLAVFSLLLAICQSSLAQRALPFREIVFEGVSVSGFHQGEPFEYFLIKRKIFAGLPLAQEAAVIEEWAKLHPDAMALPVSIIGEKSQLPMVYVWAVDGSDFLNVYLVRKGVHPAIGMLDTAKFARLRQASSNALFVKLAARAEKAGNPTGVVSRRLIPKLTYDNFVKELIAAETLAQRDCLGIWSDSFKQMREQTGLVPLSSLPLTSDEMDID